MISKLKSLLTDCQKKKKKENKKKWCRYERAVENEKEAEEGE